MILNALVERLKRRAKDDSKGRHFEATLILQAVSWYLRYPLSYRDIDERHAAEPLELVSEGWAATLAVALGYDAGSLVSLGPHRVGLSGCEALTAENRSQGWFDDAVVSVRPEPP